VANILLVDDEIMLLELGNALLKGFGHEITSYSLPNDAYKAIQAGKRWDLYVLDNCMPGLTGLELAKKLKKLDDNAPIIIVSGFLDEELEDYIENTKGLFFLSKPFKRQELATLVQEAQNF
jgi:two-component system cell cycle sensor histidine kinase/response regulator CckA